MRILAAMMKHETNSFSPVRTDLTRFEAWGMHRGEAAIRAYRDAAMPVSAYIRLAEARGADVVCPLIAEAMPSGLVEEACYEQMVEWILEPVRAGDVDAVFLDLHGAMTAEHLDDGEGELLRRLREIAPEMPVAVTLDMHTNCTAAMVENADAIIGYKDYPHTDMAAVGEQIGRVLWDMIDGKVKPAMAWGQAPILAQTLRMGTADQPMKGLQQATRNEEANGLLAATLLGGFPQVDVPHAGLSVITVADGDMAEAEAARDRLLAMAWDARDELVYRPRPVAKQIEAARASNARPAILLDHADNVGSGGTADVMTIIARVLEAGLEDVAVAAVWDPEAVRQMQDAGVGPEITLNLGGKTDMPAIGLAGRPLTVSGTIEHLSDGRWTVDGPMYTGVTVDTGQTAVFRTGGCRIVVTSLHHEPWDAGILSNNGIDPETCRFILLKSRIHYRAGFQPVQPDLGAHFTLDGDGVTTSDLSALTYERLRRPIFPLDPAEDCQ